MIHSIKMGTAALVAAFVMSGCTAMDLGTTFMGFDDDTQAAYAGMFNIVKETGDPAQAMMKEWLITDDELTEDDIFDEMKDLAGEYNMRYVGEKNMFRLLDKEVANYKKAGTKNVVVHARIAEFCSLSIAKEMLNKSRYYGGFMPCRVILVEYEDGRRYLISMDMTLAIDGGTEKMPLGDLLPKMQDVQTAMEGIPLKAAGYDTQDEAIEAMAKYYTEHNINERVPAMEPKEEE